MAYRIIDADKRHILQLEEIERQCFSMPWTAQQLESQLPDDRHVFIIAEDGDRVLGYVGMMYILDEGYISNVAVRTDCRRLGIGDALIDALERECKNKKLSFVTLEVRAGNDPAIKLYSKHGFVPVGLRRNYYEKPTEDALLMTKYFNGEEK